MRWLIMLPLVGCGLASAPVSDASLAKTAQEGRMERLEAALAAAQARISTLEADLATQQRGLADLSASTANFVDDWQGETAYLRAAVDGQAASFGGFVDDWQGETTYLRAAVDGQGAAITDLDVRLSALAADWGDRGGITHDDDWPPRVTAIVGPQIDALSARIDALDARFCALASTAAAADAAVDPTTADLWATLDTGARTCPTGTRDAGDTTVIEATTR